LYLRPILAESPTNAWITAYSASTGPILLLHWNGTKWRRISDNVPSGSLVGPIAGDGHGGLWLAADTTASKLEMLHYANRRWGTYQGPHSPVRGATLSVEYLTNIPDGQSVLGEAITGLNFGGSDGSAVIKYGS
jgi:hypothetical protein